MFWHVIGVLVIIGLVASVPSHHASLGFVFGHRLNNTGFASGATGGAFFWLYVLPIGFILMMYTQTGYDASAHPVEERIQQPTAAASRIHPSRRVGDSNTVPKSTTRRLRTTGGASPTAQLRQLPARPSNRREGVKSLT